MTIPRCSLCSNHPVRPLARVAPPIQAAPIAALLASLIVSGSGCDGGGEPEVLLRAEPLPARASRGDAPLFRRIPGAESGIDFHNELRPAHVIPYLYNGAGVTIGDYTAAIREVGAEHFLISSDLGQEGSPTHVEGLTSFAQALLDQGITEEEIDVMGRHNPATLLGLTP